jgi:hypothetical protein
MAAATFWFTGLSSATSTRTPAPLGATGSGIGAGDSVVAASRTASADVMVSSSSDWRTGFVR